MIAIPGGHGPVVDLYKDSEMGRILVEAQRDEKIIAPVCHGQAALLAARDEHGEWLFAGRRMTAFSDEEEAELGTADNASWPSGFARSRVHELLSRGKAHQAASKAMVSLRPISVSSEASTTAFSGVRS